MTSSCIRLAGEEGKSSSGWMWPSHRVRSVGDMNIAIFLMLLAPAVVSSILSAVNAPKINAQYRARRDAKRAARGVAA